MKRESLVALAILAALGCSDSSSRGPLPTASAAGGPWIWSPSHGGFPVGERMVRLDSPGGIEAWVPESYLLAVPAKVRRYVAMLDTEPNEVGLKAWHAAGNTGDPPPGAVKTLHDAPPYRVVFAPQVQILRVTASEFAAGVTAPGSRTIYLCWPPNVGGQAAQDDWIRRLIRHETSHALDWPGHHPANCPTCMTWGP